ncbi:hypothetical protein GCM10023088_16290 [Actinomadura verrucosospora]
MVLGARCPGLTDQAVCPSFGIADRVGALTGLLGRDGSQRILIMVTELAVLR